MGSLGLEVSSQVLAGALLGWLFDKWQGTAPKGITYGAVAGIIFGMWSLVRGALKLNAELEKHHPTKGRGKPLVNEDKKNPDNDNDIENENDAENDNNAWDDDWDADDDAAR